MRAHINNRAASLGSTPAGADWCLKALHPADPLTEVSGIPDKSAVPSLFMNYQTVSTISPPVNAVSPWNFGIRVHPHPISFVAGGTADGAGHTGIVNVMNAQILGATHEDKYASFKLMFQRWRLAYMSVTLYQDAPSLADQGTIVATQYPLTPSMTHLGIIDGGVLKGSAPIALVNNDELVPTFAESQGAPNAYFTRTKEGCYMPIKLTKTCQQWHSEADECIYTRQQSAASYHTFSATDPGSIFPGLEGGYIDVATGVHGGQVSSRLCNDFIGTIRAENIPVTTSFAMFIRCGFELQCMPGSMMAPHLKLPSSYDSKALKAYFLVSRELKDAYPADYNDLGKIWDVISAALRNVAPALAMIPGIGPILAAGSPVVASIGDMIKKAVDKSKSKKTLSQGDIVRIRDNVIKSIPKKTSLQVKRR